MRGTFRRRAQRAADAVERRRRLCEFFSLVSHGRFPLLTFVSMRGDYSEGNAWQMAMGKATQPVLEASGMTCIRVETEDELIPASRAAFNMAFQSEDAIALLLSQKLLGAKAFPT